MSAPGSHPDPPPGAEPGPRPRRWSRLAWVPGALLMLALVAAVVTHVGDGRRFLRLATEARPAWLLAGVALQGATYVCSGAGWLLALRHAGTRLGLLLATRLALVKLAVDQLVPTAGMSGTLVLYRQLAARGVPTATVTAAVLVTSWGYYSAYSAAVLATLLILWLHHDLELVFVGMALAFCIPATAVPLAVLWMTSRRRAPRLPGWLSRSPRLARLAAQAADVAPRTVRAPRLLVACSALQAGVFLLDAATLGTMMLALGQPAAPTACLAALVMASVAATVGFLPGGIGTFEATCVGVLSLLGSPVEAALAGTLLTRGLTFWLPMLLGSALSRPGRRARSRPAADARP